MRAAEEGRNRVVRRRRIACNEEAAQLLPRCHRGSGEVEQPGARCTSESYGKPVGHDLVVAPGLKDGLLIRQQESQRVRRAVVARRHLRLEFGWPLHLPQGGGKGSEPPCAVVGTGRSGWRGARHGERVWRWWSASRRKEDSGAPLPGVPNVGSRVPAKP